MKVIPEVRERYMTFEDLIAYEREDAAKEAIKNVEKEVKEAKEAIKKAEKEAKEAIKNAEKVAEKKARIQVILELLEEHGEIPSQLKEKLEEIDDMEILKKYIKHAVHVTSIEEFMTRISK